MNWLEVIDLDQAVRNVRTDIIGDWYYDPWGWAELDSSQRIADLVVQRLHGTGVKDTARIDVAKSNFGTRPAVIMDPIDRLTYQALVDTLSKKLIGPMSPHVFGWRLDSKQPAPGKYVRDDYQWENFLDRLTNLSSKYKAALTTDIVSFFGSIPIYRIEDQLHALQKRNKVVDRVMDMLRAWNQQLGRHGLPQRCRASSVLANMYLQPIDDLLTKMCLGRTMAWARWMDDIWLFGNHPGRLRRAQIEINDRLRELNLQLNDSKTDLLEGPRLSSATERLQKRGVDYALRNAPDDSTPIEEVLEDEILNDPSKADRTVIRYVTHRIRKHEFFDLVEEFDGKTELMPQDGDHLARLFRDSDRWTSLERWYVRYCKSDWSSMDWAVGSLCRMFPSNLTPRHVKKFIGDYLETNLTPPLAIGAVYGQRLAAWDGERGKEIFRVAAKNTNSAQARRWIALTGLSAGLDRGWTKRIRGELNNFGTAGGTRF